MALLMDKDNNAVNTNTSAATSDATNVNPVVAPNEDYETKIEQLETEKASLITETANWKMAALKAKSKSREVLDEDETEEDKMRRIAAETLASSRLAEITREQDAIIKKALKENKELKLAHLNKPNGLPTGVGSHTESKAVQDTMVTPEQLESFKKMKWTEKDIERYKNNLKRYGGR